MEGVDGPRWFNQAHNIYSFEPCAADGTPLPLDVVDHLNATYWGCSVAFAWCAWGRLVVCSDYQIRNVCACRERGDVLLLDNELCTHARTSFTGPRVHFAAFSRA